MERKLRYIRTLFGVLSFALIVTLGANVKAFAASVSVSEINYDNSTITVRGNADDTMIYFSDSKKKTWEEFPGTMTADKMMTMDMSWISLTKDYTITFKGSASADVVTVKLPKQVTTFKAKYSSGSVTFTGASGRSVQWRKDGSSIWKDYDASSDVLYPMSLKGCTVYFRLKPENASGTAVGMRPSKEVSVKVGAVTAAPTMTFNGTKLAFTVKNSMKYKVKYDNGEWPSEWTQCTKNGELTIEEIASDVLYNLEQTNTPRKAYIKFMNDATSTSQRSLEKTIEINAQGTAPNTSDAGISSTIESFESLSLSVRAASSTSPYEYAVSKSGTTWNPNTATWVKISGSSKITIKSTTAPAGCSIYVRKATKGKPGDADFAIASAPLKLVSNLTYSQKIGPGEKKLLTTVAGACRPENDSARITFTIASTSNTKVSKLEFLDEYNGTSLGTVPITSSVSGSDGNYTISCSITSTENIDANTEKTMLAKITLETGEEIVSTKEDGVRLYIYPASKINTTADSSYTASFDRIYGSTKDEKEFSFRIDFGAAKLNDRSTDTKICQITYDGYTLSSATDYSVGYETVDGSNVRTAVITVHVDKFEKQDDVKVRDKAEPLKIRLNNGETISGVTIKLIRTATIANAPIAESFTQGNLPEVNKGTDENPVWEDRYSFELNVFDNNYSVSVTDVTWNGKSVIERSSSSGGKVRITLSNKKLNEITTPGSFDLVITLSNEYKITSGYTITIN